MQNTEQSVMRSGNLNPMYGKKQSYETKKKISDTQKARYSRIRQALNEDNILNHGKDDLEARKEVLLHLLDKNTLSFRSLQQAANFFVIMLGKDNIKQLIDEEINNLYTKGGK